MFDLKLWSGSVFAKLNEEMPGGILKDNYV
jgi:hypothetical protein